MKTRDYAFTDECGNNSFKFDSQGVGTHFIVAAVIVEGSKLASWGRKAEAIRSKLCEGGKTSTKKVEKDHNRRERILQRLLELDFSLYSVIADKRALYSEGFRYKKSFYKFLNGLVYKELYRTFPQLYLVVDEHGRNDFMRSLKNYVEKRHIRDLFKGSDFEARSSTQQIGIQVADFMAGTLSFLFYEKKKGEGSQNFLEMLRPKLTSIYHFPMRFEVAHLLDDELNETAGNNYNPEITRLSIDKALDFIDQTRADDQEKQDQLIFLKLLLLQHRVFLHNDYISTKEVMDHLNLNRDTEIQEQHFRRVVGKLRDKGILIASSNKRSGGYKLPTSLSDIESFVSHGNQLVLPMLHRIQRCREVLKLATHNQLDVLNNPEFQELRKLLDSM